ncbi:zinc-binding dehydrogenase [Streptomyces sp. NBC_01239]|uniref:zinc-dependent alcohol dehydrogenase n=1 Tax=Streptomyces sp. NBC_01239 TaxID=2903792 RepID=UPI0022564C26|nr:zinc-binding dehydrogenase [Streptomyces sp. NBC_01239]MCX4815256.1 zinc-binding dehydrogenase [Streptomyces sp. NBC_01239]
MKSAIYNGPLDITVTELETPTCGPRDVLLRNLHAGICGSDVAVYRHGPGAHQILQGEQFGHEVVSEIAEVGAEVTDLSVGDRVYPYPLLAKGDARRAGSLGGFSEYILVLNCRVGEEVFKVSDRIPTPVAGLIEPFTVAHHAVRRCRPKPGEKAVVFGAGTIGIAAAVALKSFGAAEVMVVDLSEFRLAKAAALGFVTCNSAREDLRQRAAEVFGEVTTLLGTFPDVDIYIEAAGADTLLATIQAMAKPGGRIGAVAVHPEPVPIDLVRLAYGEQELIGPGGYRPEDVVDVMKIMESGRFDLASIVTHTFPLDQIVEAIETAGDHQSALHVAIAY